MALKTTFGRRTGHEAPDGATTAPVRTGNGVNDRMETTPASRGATAVEPDSPERATVERDRIDDRPDTPATAPATAPDDPATVPGTPAGTSSATAEAVPATTPAPRVRPGHTSFFATLSLIVGVCAVLASLSGRLAPVGLALGVLGLLLAAAGTAATGRPAVTGKGVAFLGLITSLAAVIFAIFAMNHTASWLDSSVDQVGRLREWLNSQLPWLQSW